VHYQRRDLVAALLAAGANANIKVKYGETSVRWGASMSTAGILQLLIAGGGNVNEADNFGITPLIAAVRWNAHDAAAQLQVLLMCPELNLDATSHGKTAEEWAVVHCLPQLALAIAEERARRERWSVFRAAWIGATATGLLAAILEHTCIAYGSKPT
jgi:hypothetical protein